MDITDLILKDHAEQRYLFSVLQEIAPSNTEQLSAMWDRLRAFLEVHAKAEELFFYPTLLHAGHGEGGMADAKSETKDAIGDHNEIRDAIASVLTFAVGSDNWFDAVNKVDKANSDHMGEEERQGLADFRKTVDLGKRHDLALEFAVFEAKNISGVPAQDIDPSTYIETH